MSSHAHIALDRLIRAGIDPWRARSRMPFQTAAVTSLCPMIRADHAIAPLAPVVDTIRAARL